MLTQNIEQMKIEVAEHIKADSVVQGSYWENGKGCFIGCLTHSNEAQNVTEKFGMPVELVKLCEGIFEGLPIGDAKDFFAAIPEAIGEDNKDLSKVVWKFLASELRALPEQKPEIQKVIDPVIEGMDLLAEGEEWSAARAARARAADAAYDAADAAARAADAAALAADAARAAAYAAADAARAAARAAAYADADAARAAARAAAYADARLRQKETILKLISEAPVN